jgi:putative transcriptional regulator
MESMRGRLLIASPALLDPNFHRAVILVGEHGEEGAMGVVLNRPSKTEVAEAVPALEDLVEAGATVSVGGPVAPGSVLVLAELDDPDLVADEFVVDGVGFVRGDADTALVAAAAGRARVFAGYAGWTAGQLEAELEQESWIVEDAIADDVFAEADELWSLVLIRKGGPYVLVATMPPDPSLN